MVCGIEKFARSRNYKLFSCDHIAKLQSQILHSLDNPRYSLQLIANSPVGFKLHRIILGHDPTLPQLR
jgi:hypothetical protein